MAIYYVGAGGNDSNNGLRWANRTVTSVGSAGAWEELTDTFTPSATPAYVVVELVSNNSATSGSFGAYFDDLAVS
jgi:hypothetical protein